MNYFSRALSIILLWVLVPLMPAAAAPDPLEPQSSVNETSASPLRRITVASGDLARSRAFYQGAMGMAASPATELTLAERRRFGLKGRAQALTFTRTGISEAAIVRVVAVPPSAPGLRPTHSGLATGGLAMGMPVLGQAKRAAAVEKAGFRSAVGITQMTLPRGDGTSYTVEEIHYQAPDGVLALGIDRGNMKPVGPIDTAAGIGGPAYASLVVNDLVAAGRFMREVLGYELRRDAVFTSAGSKGGLGLPDGTRFAFQQWFAPGAATGYVILMKMVDRPADAPPAGGFTTRGIVMWSFDVADMAAAQSRAEKAGVRIVARPSAPNTSLIFAMSDGFWVELLPRTKGITP
jgi:catechol 2,3-dioxygenase-like lactoylglutathione lyase family enzyme